MPNDIPAPDHAWPDGSVPVIVATLLEAVQHDVSSLAGQEPQATLRAIRTAPIDVAHRVVFERSMWLAILAAAGVVDEVETRAMLVAAVSETGAAQVRCLRAIEDGFYFATYFPRLAPGEVVASLNSQTEDE